MSTVHYVCKYTPIEVLAGFGATCENLNSMPEGFNVSEQIAGTNICGFGKATLDAVFAGEVHELVLVSCCDTMRAVYDLLVASGKLDFIYLLDLVHCGNACAADWMADQIRNLAHSYADYSGATFDVDAFKRSFTERESIDEPYVSILGARMGTELYEAVRNAIPMPVRNDTCVENRSVSATNMPQTDDVDELLAWYAGELLQQLPCMRMVDTSGRHVMLEDPNLAGIIYHTVRFCDFYGFEYSQIKDKATVPLVKIESDYTTQSTAQVLTRVEAFAEGLTMAPWKPSSHINESGKYFAGVDSGSTSTDVVIIDEDGTICATTILPTGATAQSSAQTALDEALASADLSRDDLKATVLTGYGRGSVGLDGDAITEITCHARGAHHIDPSVRCIIDIGGQDSKVIKLDEEGNVVNFAMNDKCAAGTGRFFDMMAQVLQIDLDEISRRGLHWNEDITISNTCTVFAESEVVSLVAQNKALDDIVHGIDKAVANKTMGLVGRVGGEAPFMMTGGVAQNEGLVAAVSQRLGAHVAVHEHAQLCGALGAALFARDEAKSADSR